MQDVGAMSALCRAWGLPPRILFELENTNRFRCYLRNEIKVSRQTTHLLEPEELGNLSPKNCNIQGRLRLLERPFMVGNPRCYTLPKTSRTPGRTCPHRPTSPR